MAETNNDDRLHVRLEWPADDQRAPARPRSRSAAPRKTGASAPQAAARPKKKAAATDEPAENAPPAPSARPPRRARPLEAPTRRAPRAAAPRTRSAESPSGESGVVLTRKRSNVVGGGDPTLASSLPAVADRVDALTHAMISLHSLVSERLSDQGAQIMDVIDGAVATLARRDDEHTKTIEDLAAQVRALREGQGELVSALTELLQRSETPPPSPADARPGPSVSPLRRRVSRWLSGAADSVGAPRSPGS